MDKEVKELIRTLNDIAAETNCRERRDKLVHAAELLALFEELANKTKDFILLHQKLEFQCHRWRNCAEKAVQHLNSPSPSLTRFELDEMISMVGELGRD